MERRINTGRAPFGYQWQDDRLVLVPDEAKVRKRIFDLFLETPRKGAVARQLNEEGLTTRGGGKWTDSVVRRYLHCPSAKGIYAINKTMTNAEGKRVPRPESEWQFFECERLISDEIWDEVQRLSGNAPASAPKPSPRAIHPFAGLAFCACGGKMRVPSNSPKYVCPSCREKVGTEELDSIFQDELGDFLSERADLLARFVADPSAGKRHLAIAKTQSVLQRLEFERENVLSLFHAKKIDFQQFGELNQPLDAQIASTRGTLDTLQRSESDITQAEEVDPAQFTRRLGEMSPKSRRAIATAFVERVEVGAGRLEFTFRFGRSQEIPEEPFTPQGLESTPSLPQQEPSEPDTVRTPVDPYFIRMPRDGERCPWTNLTRAWLNKLIAPPEGTNDPPRVISIELVDPGKTRGVRLIDFASLMAYIRSREAKNSDPESESSDLDP